MSVEEFRNRVNGRLQQEMARAAHEALRMRYVRGQVGQTKDTEAPVPIYIPAPTAADIGLATVDRNAFRDGLETAMAIIEEEFQRLIDPIHFDAKGATKNGKPKEHEEIYGG